MYAQYVYNAGSTKANVLADIVALLTGTTDKATLSAACNQANTSILTTENVAGWTLYDNAVSTNRVCLSAPCEDTLFTKYVILDMNTDNAFYLQGCETFNSGTHVGTNPIYNSSSNSNAMMVANSSTQFSAAAGGTIFISASARHMAFACRVSTSTPYCVLVSEFTRDGVNQTTDYPNWYISNVSGGGYRVRCKNTQAAGDATSQNGYQSYTTAALMKWASWGGSNELMNYSYNNLSNASVRDAIKISDMLLVGGYTNGVDSAPSQVHDIIGKVVAPGICCRAGTLLDTTSLGGKNYIRCNEGGLLSSTPYWFLMG